MRFFGYSIRLSILFLIFIFLYPLYHSQILAFSEEFNGSYSNEDAWIEEPNDGKISFTDDDILLEGSNQKADSFPFLYLKDTYILQEQTPITIEVRFKYKSLHDFGVGIILADGEALTKHDREDRFIFKVWQDYAYEKLGLHTNLCAEANPDCQGTRDLLKSQDYDREYHVLRIVYTEAKKYLVYFDDLSNPIFTSVITERSPAWLDFGNVVQTGSDNLWSELQVDYAYINHEPVPDDVRPIILIPGLGASWNYGAILNGVAGENWHLPTWVKVYDNLIATLETAGYQQDENLFLFTYDWRKDLLTLGNELDNYIQDLIIDDKIEASENINLVGHSYGGLVGRSYLQQKGDGQVNSLVTIGSPHQGATQAYGAWEGASMWNTPWWQKVAVEVLLKLNRQPGESKVEAIRRMVPSLKDLLPVYPYLFDTEEGKWKENLNLAQQNTTLAEMEADVSPIMEETLVIGGNNFKTIESLKVEERSWLDKGLDQWEDGKPVELRYSNQGDGTVLLSSALGKFSQTSVVENDHRDLVSESQGIESILDYLEISEQPVGDTLLNKSEEALVVLLQSPGELQIINPQEEILDQSHQDFEGIFLADQKMIIVPSPTLGEYTVKVSENGQTGKYQLHVGWLRKEDVEWLSFWGRLESGETDSFNIVIEESELKTADNQAYDYSEVVGELFAQVEALMADWQDRRGQRAGWFLQAAKNHVQEVINSTSAEIKNNYLRRSRFLLNSLKSQSAQVERWELVEAIEQLLYKLQDWSLQFSQITGEQEASQLKNVVEKIISYKEGQLAKSNDKQAIRTLVRIEALKARADQWLAKENWNKAQEMYLASWFWLIKT